MDIDAAKLALEAARAAGTVGSVAWDKICLYYRVEAIAAICGLLMMTATGIRLLIVAHREPFFVLEDRQEKQTRHLYAWVAGAAFVALTTAIGLTTGSRLFAQAVVPEVRAALAVHEVIMNRGPK